MDSQVVELEISLDETQEQYKNVLKNSNSKAQQRKMDFLTRNLDQLTLVQKQVRRALPSVVTSRSLSSPAQLVEQNTSLKKDVAIAERKLIARNERIQNLEALLQDAQEKLNAQNIKFEARLQAVRERLDQARGAFSSLAVVARSLTLCAEQNRPVLNNTLNFGRIAKPIKGGGDTEPRYAPFSFASRRHC